MPVRAGLYHDVLPQGRGEARHPEALEEVYQALVVFGRLRKDAGVLLGPAACRQGDFRMPGTRQDDLGYGGEKPLEPIAQGRALQRRGKQVVVDEEQATCAPVFREHASWTIAGEEGSGIFCLNGAAAKCVNVGDKVIIMAYADMTPEEAKQHKPTVLFVNEENEIVRKANYEKHGLLCNQE